MARGARAEIEGSATGKSSEYAPRVLLGGNNERSPVALFGEKGKYRNFGIQMKKLLFILAILFAWALQTQAQVIILNDNMFQARMSRIKVAVVDSLTNEPVGFASVYVIPSKDTTITNFTLTDAKGEARLDDVPFGGYEFHVELLGYKPFIKEKYFRDARVDMGTVKLQVDEQFLEAATITDIGNPIIVKQDTVEFNASSFRVGANAMLKDLLKRMPGMEITEDGKVKFNGEEIDKLTVGGRTFFFGDQSMALNNLPAAVVDKIRVIDRESEQTRASGIQDGNREKVLDVGLKKEYEKGWFGNVGLRGGTTVGSQTDDELRDDRGLLYSGNALVSAYGEKDQVTVIADAQNINDSNVAVIIINEDGERSRAGQGLSTSAQLGVNANTSRIKDVETTVGVTYKYTDTDSGTKANRTTYQDDGNLNSTSEDSGKSYSDGLATNLEFKKETGKVWFHIRPDFRLTRTDSQDNSSTETLREGVFVNSSENTSQGHTENKTANLDADVTFRELGGNSKRSLQMGFGASYAGNDGTSAESTKLTTAAGANSRAMTYDSDGLSYGLNGRIQYSEPLSDKWTLSSTAALNWSRRNNARDAFDAAGRNDYYSSISNSNYLEQKYDLTAQYAFTQGGWITLGGSLTGNLNETFSKSFGIEETTGKDDWNWYLAPNIRFQYNKGNDRFMLRASGYSVRPGNTRMLPVLNISNPSRLSLGNVYLKPYSTTSFTGYWTRNNREKFSNIMVYLYGVVNTNSITSALWYDADGILYSIPVNAKKPGFTGSMSFDYTTPLDESKIWSLTLDASAQYSSTVSYQAGTTLPGMDKDTFDYSTFMSGFWGNSAGDRFYAGLSGFKESRTQSFSPSAEAFVKYNQEHYFLMAGVWTMGRVSRYSLDPSVNMTTLDTGLMAEASYTTKHEFEFNSGITYVFYHGYAEGYGQPEWKWNAEISKSVGAFNFSLKLHDILNQTRSLRHTVTANYEEDSYRLIMGRYVLFGVKWNFGKMNAAHSQRAQRAARNMVF